MKMPQFHKEKEIEYHKVSDETVSIHASTFLPRPTNINPLGHLTLNKSIELSKRSNDKLGAYLKKPNTWLAVVVMVIAIIVVVYVIYDHESSKTIAQPQHIVNGTVVNTPPTHKPSGPIQLIPLPGLGG